MLCYILDCTPLTPEGLRPACVCVQLRQSMVRGPNHTSVIRDDYRTSYGAFLT
jgi:hypothetical protein